MTYKLNKNIYVTQPFLPPLEDFIPYLEEIWDSRILTNNGPYHQELEKRLCKFLGVKHICLFANGMLALMTALKVLRISGEVITTPFSFVATSHALLLNNIKPVFVDIEPVTYNLDPEKIEAAITSETSAILPVHVYGNPCNVERIQEIAYRHGLKVIYDAAHAFGVNLNGISVTNFGELSILSFHGTKVFNTFEGGAIVCHDEKMKQQIDHLKNFGITGETTVVSAGINAKMNEFQAAMGLVQLKYYNKALSKRERITELYRKSFAKLNLVLLHDIKGVQYNFGYFPVLIRQGENRISRDGIYEELKKFGIYSRRYFYPLISNFPMYKNFPSSARSNLPVATRISEEILCLPIYPGLMLDDAKKVVEVVQKILK